MLWRCRQFLLILGTFFGVFNVLPNPPIPFFRVAETSDHGLLALTDGVDPQMMTLMNAINVCGEGKDSCHSAFL
jgi:hypothetical protein